MLSRTCDTIAALEIKIDGIIITGDLTDCGGQAEYAQLRLSLARLAPTPVYLLAGNHDRREAMLAHLQGLPNNGGFIQYVVEDLPVRLIMLDSVVAGEAHGELCPARLTWLREQLATAPERETMLGLHHPPYLTGIPQYDATNLRNHEEFRDIIAANPQVTRIICGHHHRLAFGNVAQALCIAGPSVAYQFMLTLDPAQDEGYTLEPSSFLLHSWSARQGFVTQEIFVDRYPGPFTPTLDPEYPGRKRT
jgi:3',5'-cyclic AMP phosphodiesterase CpdA